MAIFALDKELVFPPVHLAEPDGLLAMGGDLSVNRLLLAYKSGLFPWYEGEPILWWCPNPRFVLYPEAFKESKTVKKLLAKNVFAFTINKEFNRVIQSCQTIKRNGQDGTWITDEVITSYNTMHQLGYAHSAEVWKDDELVGGLYGIKLGQVFFGESMFSKIPHASRVAFHLYVQTLKKENIKLIDCQVHTPYLESMGAKMIERNTFIQLLKEYIPS
jgi:leucyl/phenylalanyl-tRNA--protein transferase